MGLHSIERLTKGLMDAGRDANTPIAIISHAGLPTQQVMTGTLQNIVAKHEANPLPTPALLIVGAVAQLHDELAWFGENIVDTDQQAHALNMV